MVHHHHPFTRSPTNLWWLFATFTRNAFIIVAMKGRSFCPAMRDSFTLLVANAARVATVSIISSLLMTLGKVFISCFSMFFMFLFIRHPPSSLPSFFLGDLKDITSPIFPMLVRVLPV